MCNISLPKRNIIRAPEMPQQPNQKIYSLGSLDLLRHCKFVFDAMVRPIAKRRSNTLERVSTVSKLSPFVQVYVCVEANRQCCRAESCGESDLLLGSISMSIPSRLAYSCKISNFSLKERI